MIVLDTNVVSELMRPSPAERVVAWMRAQAPGELGTSAVTVAEIRYGLARLPAGRRRTDLRRAADDVFGSLPEAVLAFDEVAAGHYGEIVAERERDGEPITAFDALIAATCLSNRAVLATRNTDDFRSLGLDLVDPWA